MLEETILFSFSGPDIFLRLSGCGCPLRGLVTEVVSYLPHCRFSRQRSNSILLIYLQNLTVFQRRILTFLLIIGLLFIAQGTGYLMKGTSQIMRYWRTRHLAIGIMSDLTWSSDKKPYAWVSPAMTSDFWKIKLLSEAKKLNIKVKIQLIKVNSRRLGYFVERYNVIVNPYGSVYPESNIKDLTTWDTLSSYVLNGGTIVSLADIPFYYAYDQIKGIRYDLVKHTYHFIPLKYQQVGTSLQLQDSILQNISPFSETPFLSETHVEVINTELLNSPPGTPLTHDLEIKEPRYLDEPKKILNVAINRAFLLGKASSDFKFGNIHSKVEEISLANGDYCTPLCYINYGAGRYVVSTLFLDGSTQSTNTHDYIFEYLYKLIIREARRTFMENNQKAQKSATDVSMIADFIAKALSLQYSPQQLQVILSVPLKQLEDEVATLKAYINALK